MRPLDSAVVDLANAQSGVFAAQMAHRVGATDLDLHHWARSGELVRVRRGAYVLASEWRAAAPVERYVLRTRSVLLTRERNAWASHHAALAISGLPIVDVDTAQIDLCAKVKRVFRRTCVVTHPMPDGESCLIVNGARSVGADLAVVQTAACSGAKAGLVAVDAALHRGLATPDGLARAADRAGLSAVARQRVDHVLGLADRACESPGESLTRLLLHGLGVKFRSQVDIRDGTQFVARVDFLVHERVVVEFDGLVKYEGARGREELAREKRREDRLRRLGYEVIRLTWADLDNPADLARRLGEALARARARGS